MSLLVVSVWSVASLVGLTIAQSDTTICAWYQSRAGSVRDALFIDGGTIINNTWSGTSWSNQNPKQENPKGYLFEFNYTTPFQYSDSPPDINALVQTKPLTVDASRFDAPLYRGGSMFTDDYELYTYGGLPVSGERSASTIMNYRIFPVEEQTDNYLGPNLDYTLSGVDNYITAGASVSISSEKLAFCFSGVRSSDGGPLEQYGTTGFDVSQSMVKVDMTVPGNASWYELPLDQIITGRADAQLVWIPVSQQGILLAIGGVVHPADLDDYALSDTQIADNQKNGPGFMTTIAVYDIANNKWYNQKTTGDPPGPLARSCTVVAHEPDSSSFEIFLYGGDDGWTLDPQATAKDDVWALSVPSFTWSKVWEGNPEHGRSAHVCSLPSPDQMLIFGGWNLNQGGFCIADGSVTDVFSLSDLSWTKEYDPSSKKDYTAPATINKAARTIDSDIQALFDQQYDETKIKHWYPYKGGSSGNSPPIAAIAGGAGGGAAAIIIAFLVWYLWPSCVQRRRVRKQSDAGTTSALRNGRVFHWLPGVQPPSADLPAIPKDLASESTTEVDGQMSPPPTAEAYGDYYFRGAPHVSSTHHNPAAEVNSHPSTSCRRISYQSVQPPRSPRSPAVGSVEHDGEEVHEKDGNVRDSQLSDLGQGALDFRQHPQYPYSIDRVASSDTNSNSSMRPHRHGALGSNVSHLSGHSRHHSNITPSPVAAPASVHEVDNGDVNANEKGVDTIQPLRPSHQRNASSMSSNLPITPPGNGNGDRPPLEMRMSSSSGPISPFLHQELSHAYPNRPSNHRHGSSGFSRLSGEAPNIALPPPVHPMSPSSVYSPTTAGVGTGTDAYTDVTAGTSTGTRREEGTIGTSAANTLVGNGPSPMTEKANPLAAMVASFQSPGSTSAAGTRRKPVGCPRGPTGLGLDSSSYEENGGSHGRNAR